MVFDKIKQGKADTAAAQVEAQRAARVEQLAAAARAAWEAWDGAKLEAPESAAAGVVLKKGEVIYGHVSGALLIEPRRAPGHWAGQSSGYSFRVAKGVNYRVGSNRGQYVQGAEQPTVVDQGLFVVTNQRCLFLGPKKTTEWAYAKLVGFSLDGDALAIFNVSNRQKATGVAYGRQLEPRFDAMITAAVARFNSEQAHAAVVAELGADYAAAYGAWQGAGGVAQPG